MFPPDKRSKWFIKRTTYQYPEGSGACFHKKLPLTGKILKSGRINTPKGRGRVSTLLTNQTMYPQAFVSIPRRVGGVFPLPHIAYFTTLFHFCPHILPFFRLRASQKNKFRRRCSYFSFLLPPYLAFSIISTPIYRGS